MCKEEETEFVNGLGWSETYSLLNTEDRIGRDLMETCPKKRSETTGGSELLLAMEFRAQVKSLSVLEGWESLR